MPNSRRSPSASDASPSAGMRAALRAARRGLGRVSPNPLVGAALVSPAGRIVTDYHARYGGRHAEARLLDALGKTSLRGATLYLTLEPCSIHGKTPPCVDRVIKARPSRVIIATLDPNPQVAGRGVAALRKAGIRTDLGDGENEAVALNLGFFLQHLRRRARVHLKLATSLDGAIATDTGESRWITGPEARREVHRDRSRSDAVVVGAGTVAADDPELTVRQVKGPQPSRIVIDSSLRTPPGARVWRSWSEVSRVLVASGDLLEGNHLRRVEPEGVPVRRRPRLVLATRTGWNSQQLEPFLEKGWEVWKLPTNRDGRVSLRALVRKASRAGLLNLYIEGGQEITGALLRADLVDELSLYQAPMILGGGRRWSGSVLARTLSAARRFVPVAQRRFGDDLRCTFRRESLLEDLLQDVHRIG